MHATNSFKAAAFALSLALAWSVASPWAPEAAAQAASKKKSAGSTPKAKKAEAKPKAADATAKSKKAADVPEEVSTLAAPRSAVAFGFGGKLGPKDEDFVPGFETYRLRFGPGDWAGARIIITTAWGDKNPQTDLWNWPDGLNVRATDAKSDEKGSYFLYSLATANEASWVVANFRYTLRDGRHGVANAVIPYGGDPEIAADTVAVLACEGKLGPKDVGYVPEFDSYKLRFGAGDWEGAKISVGSHWGEGNDGKDLWGWKDGSEDRISEIQRDAKGYYFIQSLRSDGHSRWVASLYRVARKDGRWAVAKALYSHSAALPPPKPTGQPAGYPDAPALAARKVPKPTARTLAAARPTKADLDYLQALSDDLKGLEPDDFATLTELNLAGKAIDDEGMSHLRGLKQLRKLSLQGTRVGDAGLENLAGLSSLRDLNLIGTPTTDAGLEVLGRLSGLITLNLDMTLVTGPGLGSLRKLKGLEVLTLANDDVGDSGLAALKGLPAIRTLNLGKDPAFVNEGYTEEGFSLLKAHPNLGSLQLSSLPIGDAHLAKFAGLPKLHLLDLTATQVTNAGLVHLKSFPELNQLTLSQTPITGAGLAPLRSLPKLNFLFLGFSDIGDEGLAQIGGMKALRFLSIVQGNVSDAGFVHLKGLTNLDRIHFPDNKKIQGTTLENLRGLSKLESLNLYANNLDDASLAALKALPELRLLYVSGEKITDAGLAHIKAMPKLEYLNISWTKATQAGIDDLKKSLPKLRVDYGDF